MNRLIDPAIVALAIPVLVACLPATAIAEEAACPFYENRTGLCGYYHSEISPAEAFLDTVVKRGRWSRPSLQPVILDVRSIPEYKAGHPEHAINVPFPFIYQYCDTQGRTPDGACINNTGEKIAQNSEDFVAYVKKAIPNKDTPIYTLCRTGVRSVGSANLLTDEGYTNVRSIWEGFVGVNLTAPKKQADGTTKVSPVDLNHDGKLDDEDNNGWRYHQGLPYSTRLLPKLIYQTEADLYHWVE